ncbi:hypothetical protein AWC38_SpisGene23764 [Stylophora pistillata]|uniref:Uncharacterized protein n=1 Tax=Stylophora pistillata TaxID=50429 RepID=A0A2B4R7U8_STYPI|nr:hypothetical protein AWC38_SpisGene23764 [Stylophora pistillata]
MNEIEEMEDDSEDIHSTGLIKSRQTNASVSAVCSEDMNDIEEHLHDTEVSDSQYDLVAPNAQNVELQDEGSSCAEAERFSSTSVSVDDYSSSLPANVHSSSCRRPSGPRFASPSKQIGTSITVSDSDVWNKMNALIVDVLKQYEEICLCGDGRNDSPGHSASEITIDASSSIIKLVREMKDKFPQLELLHSLDIWHKAKKLSKCIHQAARVKGCESLKEWIDDIVSHFWFCYQNCEGRVEGECRHSPEETPSNGKTYLKKSSKALSALRKVVLDKKWLSNLAFYVRFRHTSVLESYNSMLTKYAPKRMALEYPYFIMRIMLTAIDHNMHLCRGQQLNAAGEERGHRKFSKRTQIFHAETVKEEKGYPYFIMRIMLAAIDHNMHLCRGQQLNAAGEERGHRKYSKHTQKFHDCQGRERQIAPTIAMKAAPSTEELKKGRSRLAKPPLKKWNSSTGEEADHLYFFF